MNRTMVLGGVLDNVYGTYERPILFLLSRTVNAEKRDSCILEVYWL